MKELTLKQIAEWCGGRLPPEYAALTITGVQSDSRHVRAGDLFVALKGERTDGHVYVKKALADGAVKHGVPRAAAYQLASQMLAGTAKLKLATGQHPGVMKDAVCSPGGTTIIGVAALERAGLRSSVIEAIDAIVNR